MNINQIHQTAVLGSGSPMMQMMNQNRIENISEKGAGNFEFKYDKQNVELNQAEQVELMIENIEEVKKKIDGELTVESVLKYKELVTSFLKYYTENVLSLETMNSQHTKYGYREKMTIVKKAEDGVRDIEDMMDLLETKSGHLEMLKKIGEINGMVMNLRV